MADQQKIVLELEAKTKKLVADLKKVKKAMKGVDDQSGRFRITTAGLRRSIGALRNNMLLVSFAFGGTAAAVGKLIGAYGQQQLAERKLSSALGFTSEALLTQASALQQQTSFGDEAIIGVQALIGAFTKDEEKIKELTKATLDLAAAKGMDLTAAADLVSKSFGSSTNALSRYGIEVKGAVGSTERLESLTGNVASLFGGQAAAQADTMTGSIEQMKNAMGDTAENMGALLEPATISISNALAGAARHASEFFLQLKETDMETAVRHLREMGIAGEDINLLEQYTQIQTHTDTILSSNDKIFSQLRKQGGMQKVRTDLSNEEVESLGGQLHLLDKNVAARHRLVQGLDHEKMTSENIGTIINDRIEQSKKLVQGKTELNKKEQRSLKDNLSTIDYLTTILGLVHDRVAAEEALALVGKAADTSQDDSLTPEQIFLEQFETFKAEKDVQLEKYEHEQALIAMLVEDHKKLAESLGLETDAQRDLRIETDKANALKKKSDDQAAKAKAASTKAITKNFIEVGKLYHEDADKATDAVIDKISAYAADAAAKQMANVITKLSFPANAIVAPIAGAAIGFAIQALVAPLKSKQAQYGMDEVVDEPTMILAGEAGAEQVSITPLESPNIDGVQGGGASIVVNVSGNILTSDFVEGELADNIREAVRRGTDFGIG